jgi:hypothetical protein
MVKPIFKKLKLPLNEKMKFVEKMVLLHLRPIVLSQEKVTDSAVRRLMMEIGEDIDQLMKLCKSDITSKNEKKVERIKQNFAVVEEKIKQVAEKDYLRNWQPPISGTDIINRYQIIQKEHIGLLKNAVKQSILDGTVADVQAEAFVFLDQLAHEMGIQKK